LREEWTIARLGIEILRARAEDCDRRKISALRVIDQTDPIALAFGGWPDPATLWRRVTRPPEPGEVTNATRGTF